jgi:hypothetical protein
MKRPLIFIACLAIAAALALAPSANAALIGGHNETSENLPLMWTTAVPTPTPGQIFTEPAGPHLLLSEVCVTPTAAEFIEICNPTGQAISLDYTYLSDDWYTGTPSDHYYEIVAPGYAVGTNTDYTAKFPPGSVILPGQRLVIAYDATAFKTTGFPGVVPNFEFAGQADDPAVPNMVIVSNNLPLSTTGIITNTAEMVMLFHWDGLSDNVCDNDYVCWGSAGTGNRVDKTGVAIDGPDGDAIPTAFFPDTPPAAQVAMPAPGAGSSIQRVECMESNEASPGNGCIPGATPTKSSTWGEVKVRYR